MANLGNVLCSFKPDKVGLFGNQTTNIEVYTNGVRLTRKKGVEELEFGEIEKIIAGGYASPTPIYIYITILLKNGKGKIEFQLHPNLKDTNALLNAYSDYLLGSDFPNNLETLDIELGGFFSVRLRNGKIVVGDREIPLSEVEQFTRGNNGFYNLKISSIKQSLGITPDNAQNIVSTIKIMQVILGRRA